MLDPRRFLPLALLLLALTATNAVADDSNLTLIVIGGDSLSRSLERSLIDSLTARGFDVSSRDEIESVRRFLAGEPVNLFDDAGQERTRRALASDAIITVELRPEADSVHVGLSMRTFDDVDRRFGSSTPDRLAARTLAMIEDAYWELVRWPLRYDRGAKRSTMILFSGALLDVRGFDHLLGEVLAEIEAPAGPFLFTFGFGGIVDEGEVDGTLHFGTGLASSGRPVSVAFRVGGLYHLPSESGFLSCRLDGRVTLGESFGVFGSIGLLTSSHDDAMVYRTGVLVEL